MPGVRESNLSPTFMISRAASHSPRALFSRSLTTTSLRRTTRPPSADSTPPQEQTPPTSPEPTPSSSTRPDYDIEQVRSRLAEISDRALINLRTKADDFTTTTKITFSRLGAELNKVTGYEAIEALKRQVVEQGTCKSHPYRFWDVVAEYCVLKEERINATRHAARAAKNRYEDAVSKRSNSQREVNDLLQRKSMWSDHDVSRFTALVREDHLLEQEEARAKDVVDESEAAQEREFSELMRAILGRYHEEQVWSDKIRSASTYGQLAALALNLLVFISAILFVEPWKRKRLAQTFERKTEELSLETRQLVEAGINDVKQDLQEQVRVLTVLAEAAVKAERERETLKPSPILLQTSSFWDRAVLSGVAAGAVTASVITYVLYT